MLRRSPLARRPAARRPARRLSIQTLEARDVPDAFQPGNVVIYRVGDGTATLTSNGNAVFLDEYIVSGPQAGTLRQSIAMPTTVSGSNKQLISGGTATAEGLMTRSADGAYLVMTGYARDLGGTTALSGTNPVDVARTIARVGADGSVDTSTALTDLPNGSASPRGIASADGSGFWISTQNNGIWYSPFGPAATSTQLNNTVTTMRYVNVFNGQLYTSANTGSFRLGPVGTGLPTTSGQSITNLPGFETTGSPYGFFFADLDAGVVGVDTLYVANDDAFGLRKYSLVNGNWTLNGSVGVDTDDYRGLAATVSGTTVTLVATRKGSELVSLVDSSGYNGAFSGTPTPLASAGTNKAFRGVAMAPVFNAAPVNTVQDQTTNEDVGISLAGLSVTDPDSGTTNIQVTFSLPAGTGTMHVFDNITGGVTAAQISGNDSTSVTMTAPVAAIKKTIENTPFGSGIAYFPAGDFNGPVTITMKSDDLGNSGFGGAKTDTDTFIVTVFGVNDAPVNKVQDQATNEDVGTTLAGLSVADPDAGTANIQVKFSVPAGTGIIHVFNVTDGVTAAQISGNDSTSVTMTAPLAAIKKTIESSPSGSGIAFTPAGDFNGPVTVTMTSDDLGNTGSGGAKSDTDTFTITVNPVNDTPVVTGGSFKINEGTVNGTVVGTITATDVENNALTFTISGGNTGGAFAIHPATGELTVANTGALTGGTFNLTVAATDNGSPNETGFAPVTIVVNAKPVVTQPIGDRAVFEDAPPIVIDLGPSFADAEDSDAALKFSVTDTSDPSLFSSVTVAGTTLTLTLAPNVTGLSAVTVRATDTGGLFVENALFVFVTAVNDAPTFDAIGNVSVNAGTPTAKVNLTGISAGPADESAQTVTIVATSSNPAVVPDPVVDYGGGSTGTLTLNPVAATGTATITVTATDNGGTLNGGVNTRTRTFTFTLNAAPTTTGLPDQTILEDSDAVSVNLATAFEDAEDGDNLSYKIVGNTNPALFASAPSFAGNFLNLTPGPDAFGDGSLTVRATDSAGLFVDASFNVTVTPVNDAPTLDAIGGVTIDEDAAEQTVNLAGISAGPTNETGQKLTVTAASDNPGLVPNPTVDFAGGVTGALHFSPVADGNGSAIITVTVTDDGGTANGGANTIVRTLTVTVGAEDDRPVLDTAGTPTLPAEKVFGKVLAPGGLISDLTENVTDADAGALKGVAIVAADTAKGRWQYNLSGDPLTWQNFPTDLSPANALLLADDGNTLVRFVPKPKYNGFASLTFHAWDQSNGAAEGTRDDATDAADIAYSTKTDRGWVAVGRTVPKVDADGRSVIPAIREDSRLPRVVTVKSILGLAKLEAAPKTNLGLALTGASTLTGTWQFRLAGTTAWQNVESVSDAAALLLRPTDVLRFKPASNADTDATLTFKVWDQTGGTAGLPLVPATGTAFGTDPGRAVLDIKAVNDAPVLDLSHAAVLNPVDAGGTTNAATFASLMSATDVEGANVGVAVFQASGPGTWHYRPAGGADTVLPRVSTLKALLLAADTEVWFEAADGTPAATAKLSFRAWDRSNLKPVGGFAAIAGSAYSKQAEVLTVAIGNSAPTLIDGSPALPDIVAGSAPGTGISVKALLGTAVTDTNLGALRGIAITGTNTTAANGTWEYSLGLKWVAIGPVSKDAALLLPETARIRFVPAAGVTSGTATIDYKAWDRTAGMIGDRIDTDGGLNSFSDLTETATVTVNPA
ncbi:MAG TPA: Ig-like domain-containing protein [Gemmataceae bacterium]|nr:Ig-like domain-containing protein [Gemmataceae bacterium]